MSCGLILEGGGLRGVYTSGVLDYFSENNIEFPYIIGVSMGACNAANFVSGQAKRNKFVNIEFVNDKRYLSYRKLIKSGELFQTDFIYNTIPNEINVFDYDTMYNNSTKFWITVTNCITGKAEYFEKNDLSKDFSKILIASTSLPFISHPVNFRNQVYMDGGLADSIPLQHSIDAKNKKHVVILTRHKGYQKKQSKAYKLARLKYGQFPGLIEAMKNRAQNYNRTIKWIEKLESENKIFVLRPSLELKAKRIERDKKVLYKTYDLGYKDTKLQFENLLKYLEK